MTYPDFKKQILPHLIAVFVFLALSVVFYWPAVMEGKGVFQNDVYQGIAAGNEVADFRTETGEEALWIHSMFSGMPAYLINTRHYGEWLINGLQKLLSLGLPGPAWLTFLAMLSFYILLLVFGVRPGLAIAGAISYGLSTFGLISIEAGHNWKVGAMATMPLVLAGVHACLYKHRYWGFVGTILAVALQIKMNHLQITYYLLLGLIIYGGFQLWYLIKDKNLAGKVPNMLLLVLAALVAVGMSLGRLWVTSEYSTYSQRGPSDLEISLSEEQSKTGLDKDYAFNWSLGKLESFTLVLPNFYGGATVESLDESSALYETLLRNGASPQQARSEIQQVPTYWGDQPFTSGPVYAGALVVFLLILSLFTLPSRHMYWMLAAILFSLALAWGKNFEFFNYAMFDYFPGYNKFRAVSMAAVIALMVMPLMAFLGLEYFIRRESGKERMTILIQLGKFAGGLVALLLVLYFLMDFTSPGDDRLLTNGYPDWYISALEDDRASLYFNDWLRTFLFMSLGMAFLFFFTKGALQRSYLLVGMVLLVTADLYPVGLRYLHPERYTSNPSSQFLQLTDANKRILDANEDARTLYLLNPWNDARISYHHQSVGGYHGAKLRRYQELIDWHLDAEHMAIVDSIQNQGESLPFTPVLNMLNTRFFIAGTQAEAVLENPYAAGNAWLINDLIVAESADEELLALSEINLYSQALSTQITADASYNADGELYLEERRPNYLKYRFNTPEISFAVFSEIYYPKGWKALLNGEEVDIKRVNFVLRGLELPQGEGELEFFFQPQSYYLGNQVANLSNILVLLLIGGGVVYQVRRKPKMAS